MEHTDLDFVNRKCVLDLDILLEHSLSTTESASEVRQGSPFTAGVQGSHLSSANNCSQITWSPCCKVKTKILIHHYNMSETCRVNMLAWLYYTRWQQKCSTTPWAKTVRPRSGYTSISLLDSGRTRHSQCCSDQQKTANKFIKETWISYET